MNGVRVGNYIKKVDVKAKDIIVGDLIEGHDCYSFVAIIDTTSDPGNIGLLDAFESGCYMEPEETVRMIPREYVNTPKKIEEWHYN